MYLYVISFFILYIGNNFEQMSSLLRRNGNKQNSRMEQMQ